MDLLRTLRMPFQATSLMFVTMVSVIVYVAVGLPGANPLMSLLALWIALSWFNKYAFALLDQAANGITKAPVASVEMLGPFGDVRAWVHPSLAVLVAVLAWWLGRPWGVLATLAGAALMPASAIAIAMSGHVLDALDPRALFNVLRGMGRWYLLVLAAALFFAGEVWLLRAWSLAIPLGFALGCVSLLVLVCLIGGLVHRQRLELGFEPIVSPERQAVRLEQERIARRQAVMDEFYALVRARDLARATATLSAWLTKQAPGTRLAADVATMIEQATRWPEQKGLAALLRAVIAHALATRQGALAVLALEAGLARIEGFEPADAEQRAALARHARLCGRRQLALRLGDDGGPASRG